MTALRLVGRVAILWLLDLHTVWAARLDAVAAHPGLGALAGRGRRRGLFAALLLGSTASHSGGLVEDMLDPSQLDVFSGLDADKDERLSRQEYEVHLENVVDPETKLLARTVFLEADIDGDELLSLAEYMFSRLIITDSASRKAIELIAAKSNTDLFQKIEATFLDLRRRFPGSAGYTQVSRTLWKGLGVQGTINRQSEARFRKMFKVADVTADGVLNVNELDFLHFLVREDFITGHIEEDLKTSKDSEEQQAADLMGLCDLNEDGHIDYMEAIESFAEYFGGLLGEEKLVRERITRAFRSADANGDGSIDVEEAPGFGRAIAGER